MSMTKYWLCILSPENYEIVKEKLVWGVADRHKNVLAQVEPGDKLVMYVTGEKKVKGIFEAVSKPYIDEKKIFPMGIYKHRVKLKLIKSNEEGIDIRTLLGKLSMFVRKDSKWAGVLRGRAMIELNKMDYDIIDKGLK